MMSEITKLGHVEACKHNEQRILALVAEIEQIKRDRMIESKQNAEISIDKKGIKKRLEIEPLGDVISAILRHPPKDEKECKEQQLSVRYAISTDKAEKIVGKITKVFIVSAITVMIASIAPFLGGILGEILATLLKYQLI